MRPSWYLSLRGLPGNTVAEDSDDADEANRGLDTGMLSGVKSFGFKVLATGTGSRA